MSGRKLTVTSPLLPDLHDFTQMLEDIWESKWITNNGALHKRFEAELANKLGIEHISLFTNGTLPLLTALQALDIKGEVITTPYSFVATTHSLWWNGLTPVFADIDPDTCNIDPQRIEDAITPRTTAIMPVHCYGTPCDTDAIRDIAERHGLKVIYDAAHAFGVERDGRSILDCGDMATLSFHATKVFNTIEGGALICHSQEMKQKIDYLKNFGFANEVTVIAPGINSKMDEVRAAYGLLNLRQIDKAIAHRKKIAEIYRAQLDGIPGLRYMNDIEGVRHNYSYFPVFINESEFGMSRDAVYEALKAENIYGRRYYYPLISQFPTYSSLPSATERNLPYAHRISSQVICLPIHHEMTKEDTDRVVGAIIKCHTKNQPHI